MTSAQRAHAASGTVALPRTWTTAECREIVTKAFRKFGRRKLPSLIGVELVEPDILDRSTTDRTILSVAVVALNAAGIPTQNNVGDVRSKLGMDQEDVDDAFCFCVNGEHMSGRAAALRMGEL